MTILLMNPSQHERPAVERDSAAAALQAQLEQLTRLSQQFSGTLQTMQARYKQVTANLA